MPTTQGDIEHSKLANGVGVHQTEHGDVPSGAGSAKLSCPWVVPISKEDDADRVFSGGVTDTEDSAKEAAVAWMRRHQADCAVIERVRLSTSTRLVPGYLSTGYVLAAERRKNHRIVWTRVRVRETELAAS